jgi:diacylglycerol O-acyltransferase / wax synthase
MTAPTQLGVQDSQFLYADTENSPANVAMVLIFGPPQGDRRRLDLDTLTEHIRSRLHTSAVFRRRLRRVPLNLDYPYWIDDALFDVDFHLQYTSLPKPGTWAQFKRFVSRYHNKPLDMHRPLWEICLVDGLDAIDIVPKGAFALIVKSHHAAIDGTSGMQFFSGLLDTDAEGTPSVEIDSRQNHAGQAPASREVLAQALLNNIRAPIRIMESIIRAMPGIVPMLTEQVVGGGKSRRSVPDTRFNRAVSPVKQFDATWFSLADFKTIKNSVAEATINDVVLAVSGGALRSYLSQHKELPEESLIAWVPINARAKVGTTDKSGGNAISAMTVPLFTELEDPRERLSVISALTRKFKQQASGHPTKLLLDVANNLPAYTVAVTAKLLAKANTHLRLCNAMITNVPGPQQALFLQGSKCIYQFGLTPIGDGLGLVIGTPSYNGEIAFTVMSTPTILPDMEAFMRYVRDSFEQLKAGCARTKVPKKRRK